MYNKNLDKMNKETLRMQMLSGIITEGEYKAKLEENAFLKEVSPTDYPEDIKAMEREIQDLKNKLQSLMAAAHKAKSDYTKTVPSLKDDPEFANINLPSSKKNQYAFKTLVDDVKKVSDESGNDWDALNKYLEDHYNNVKTYTRDGSSAIYVVGFFSISKTDEDEFYKKNPSRYITIGDWAVRPW
jgi:hypothetical protein